jgi:hypothetical protein
VKAHANFNSRRAQNARWCAFSHSATPPYRAAIKASAKPCAAARAL